MSPDSRPSVSGGGTSARPRIGLVGYGVGGRWFHLPFIQAVPDWHIVGVVTRSQARRAVLQEQAPAVPAFDSLDALLDAGVDIVVITTPPETHEELAVRALRRGAHVVVDKPFAPDAASAARIAEAALSTGRILTVFHNRRWDTDIVTLAALIASGALGTVWRVASRFDLDDPGGLATRPAHGLLRDLGSHLVDQMTALFGPVAAVDAHLDRTEIDGVDVDCGFVVSLRHKSGVHSSVASSKLNHLQEREILVHASAGSYVSRMSDVQARQIFDGHLPGDRSVQWGVEEPGRWGELHTAAGVTRIPSAQGDYSEFYRRLLTAVRGDGPAPVLLEEALHTMVVLDAARRSAELGRSIELR